MNTIIELGYITLMLKRINNYNTNHQDGYENIPHLCIKIKHNNGYAWFGLSILKYNNVAWTERMRATVKSEILLALGKLTDLVEVVSDMDRTIDSILEVVNEKKTNLLIANNNEQTGDKLDTYALRNERIEQRNVLLTLNLANSVIFEVYDGDFDVDKLSYGGFALEVELNNKTCPGILFHRSVVLNNYIDEFTAKEIVEHTLNGYLHLLSSEPIKVNVIKEVVRARKNNSRVAM